MDQAWLRARSPTLPLHTMALWVVSLVLMTPGSLRGGIYCVRWSHTFGHCADWFEYAASGGATPLVTARIGFPGSNDPWFSEVNGNAQYVCMSLVYDRSMHRNSYDTFPQPRFVQYVTRVRPNTAASEESLTSFVCQYITLRYIHHTVRPIHTLVPIHHICTTEKLRYIHA